MISRLRALGVAAALLAVLIAAAGCRGSAPPATAGNARLTNVNAEQPQWLPCGHLVETNVRVADGLREATCKQGHAWVWSGGKWQQGPK
jgi:hypothetical protein